jgi:hypothetical protein
MGDCDPDMALIKVSKTDVNSRRAVPPEILEHSRWHEQVHYMLRLMGRMDLYEDEDFVDTLAGLLAQYEATKKIR